MSKCITRVSRRIVFVNPFRECESSLIKHATITPVIPDPKSNLNYPHTDRMHPLRARLIYLFFFSGNPAFETRLNTGWNMSKSPRRNIEIFPQEFAAETVPDSGGTRQFNFCLRTAYRGKRKVFSRNQKRRNTRNGNWDNVTWKVLCESVFQGRI